jgi:hypothetical protein
MEKDGMEIGGSSSGEVAHSRNNEYDMLTCHLKPPRVIHYKLVNIELESGCAGPTCNL